MESDALAKSVLEEELGFEVRKLEESTVEGEQRADFLATLSGLPVLVEAKVRNDADKDVQELDQGLARSGSYSSKHQLGRSNTLSGIARGASEQLDSEHAEHHQFKVLLFLADCLNPRVVIEQMTDTLFGGTTVLHWSPGASGYQEQRCYFYSDSEFYRRKTLDAAIIGYRLGKRWQLTLCLNPYSGRIELLRSSALAALFADRVIDPVEEEARGAALLPGPDAPRPRAKAEREMASMFPAYDPMLRHLEQKYKLAAGSLSRADFNKPLIVVRQPR